MWLTTIDSASFADAVQFLCTVDAPTFGPKILLKMSMRMHQVSSHLRIIYSGPTKWCHLPTLALRSPNGPSGLDSKNSLNTISFQNSHGTVVAWKMTGTSIWTDERASIGNLLAHVHGLFSVKK